MSALSNIVLMPGYWRTEKWPVWQRTELKNVFNFNSLNRNGLRYIGFAAKVVLSVLCTLKISLMLRSTTRHARCVSPDNFLFHLLVCLRDGIWATFRLSWPSLFLFSRKLKAALHLLSCCRFSQRLRKPGDLNGMATQRIILQNYHKRKSCVGSLMMNTFL